MNWTKVQFPLKQSWVHSFWELLESRDFILFNPRNQNWLGVLDEEHFYEAFVRRIEPPLQTGNELEIELMLTSRELNLSESDFRQTSESEALSIIEKAKRIFVVNGAGVWWFGLNHIEVRKSFHDGPFRHLLEEIPVTDRNCWFIAD